MADKELRAILGEELEKLMEQNDKICVVDADLAKANGTVGLRKKFPDRALDVGIAEQNMASVAAGLASYGMIPFIGTFTPFASRRICDQITISISYAKQNVKILATDPGVTAELNGGTHMSVEDIGVIRSIPGMVIVEPVDAAQVKQMVPQVAAYEGPVYIRMFRKKTPDIFTDPDYKFELFKADKYAEGSDVTIMAGGILMYDAIKAVELLKEKGIAAELLLVHTYKPLDEETILESVRKTGAAVVAENHSVIGGLGSAVAELLSDKYPVPVKRVGIQDHFGEVGKIDELKEKYHMTAADIVAAAEAAIRQKAN